MSFIEEKHSWKEVLEEWPLYKHPFGYKLVESKKKYKGLFQN